MMGSVNFDGVTFVVSECAKMTKDEFIRNHCDVFWLDRDVKTRKKMLAEVYSLIAPGAASKKK